MRRLLVGSTIAALALISLGLITASVISDFSFGLDRFILAQFIAARNDVLTVFFQFVTTLAGAPALLFLLAVFVVIWWRQKVKWMVLAAGLVTAQLSSSGLKFIVDRQRPEEVLSLVHTHTPGFPSGHALRATVFFGLLTYLLYWTVKSVKARTGILLGAVVLVLLVGASRVYLGAHFPTDVLAGFFLGVFILSVFITFIESKQVLR